MNATRDQIVFLKATLWPDACEAQGWNVKDRDLQMRVLSEIVGREITSSNDLEKIKEFGKVKRDLQTLAGRLDGAMDSSHEDEARRQRHFIRTDLLPCIALYRGGRDGAETFMASIIQNVIHRGRKVETRGLDELTATPRVKWLNGALRESPSELQVLIMTLTDRLNSAKPPGLRNQAGDTLHEMRVKAQVGCACKQCSGWAALGMKFDAHFQLVPILADGHHGSAAATPVQEPEMAQAGEENPF